MSASIIVGDALTVLRRLPDALFHCAVTSPPYWGLRDYGVQGQIGMETSLEAHLEVLRQVFAEVRRVLRPEGTCWINYGDCYATQKNGRSAADTKANGADDRTHRDKPFSTIEGSGLRSGNLCLIPERLALLLQADGWFVRSRIVWGKANTKPDSSGRFRPSYNHEMIWMLSKQSNCYYDSVAVRQATAATTKARLAQDVENQTGSFRQPGKTNGAFKAVGDSDTRLLRAYEEAPAEVWRMATASFREAHTATFPPELVERCLRAGTSEYGVCASCGAPWNRHVAKTFLPQADVSAERGVRGADGQKPLDASSRLTGTRRGTTAVETLGWGPSCECSAGIAAPAIVLDPFIGSGTTALVARTLGRKCVGIELNSEYAEIARQRIGGPVTVHQYGPAAPAAQTGDKT